MRKVIENQTYDEERALYALKNADIVNCVFAGKADGESVLKETKDISVKDCKFSLRYPMWHVDNFLIENSTMDELTRAALWYSNNGVIKNSTLNGIKAVRECNDVKIYGSSINSSEFGWKSNKITLESSEITSEYLFFDSKNVKLNDVKMKGKYSFQYIENLEITNSYLDTKDAFWHSKNILVKDCVVKGEYLGWFSEGLTLINCKIIGTQPLCYAKNLTLINCETENCDLAFEYSEVNAEIKGNIVSVKNPKSGKIIADTIGEIILENSVMECKAEIIEKNV